MPSHTTAFSFRQLSFRQLSFRRLGASLCLSGALAAALGGCASLNSSPSASAEASSEPTAASHATAPVIQDSEGFRLFTGRGPIGRWFGCGGEPFGREDDGVLCGCGS